MFPKGLGAGSKCCEGRIRTSYPPGLKPDKKLALCGLFFAPPKCNVPEGIGGGVDIAGYRSRMGIGN